MLAAEYIVIQHNYILNITFIIMYIYAQNMTHTIPFYLKRSIEREDFMAEKSYYNISDKYKLLQKCMRYYIITSLP